MVVQLYGVGERDIKYIMVSVVVALIHAEVMCTNKHRSGQCLYITPVSDELRLDTEHMATGK